MVTAIVTGHSAVATSNRRFPFFRPSASLAPVATIVYKHDYIRRDTEVFLALCTLFRYFIFP